MNPSGHPRDVGPEYSYHRTIKDISQCVPKSEISDNKIVSTVDVFGTSLERWVEGGGRCINPRKGLWSQRHLAPVKHCPGGNHYPGRSASSPFAHFGC